ncbi:MAG: arsenite methyltransferase [Planctomycetia bacterium]
MSTPTSRPQPSSTSASSPVARPAVPAAADTGCAPASGCCGPAPVLGAGEDPRALVRARYGAVAQGKVGAAGCCNGPQDAEAVLAKVGYDDLDKALLPEGANLGLGCGNPVAFAEIRPGDTVLDLGSGGDIDCFLAARRTGPTGRVIGVDMTPERVERARALAAREGLRHVQFRLGEIEALPVANGSVDVVISNCVVNLSPDKAQVFREAARVLKPGGRLMLSDIVLARPLPPGAADDPELYAGCIGGALLRDDYLRLVREAGFEAVEVLGEAPYMVGCDGYAEGSMGRAAFEAVVSIHVRAVRGAACCPPGCC